MRVGLYLKNDKIPEVDLSRPKRGNPGIGGTQYNFVTLPYYFNLEMPNHVEFLMLANHADKLPKSLKRISVRDGCDAVVKAANENCDIFVYRPTNDKENLEIINTIERMKVIGVAWAHSDVSSECLDALSQSYMIKKYVCVGREQFKRHADHPVSKKATFIVNGFDPAPYIPREEVAKTYTVVYLGNLIPAKGFHYLARVWPLVSKYVPEARLVVIGNGLLYNRSEALGRWGIASEAYEADYIRPFLSDSNGRMLGSVRFAGLLGYEKVAILQKAAVGVVNPSALTENCPGCAIEISAAGTPVVSRAAMGLLDTVVKGRTGLLGETLEDLAKNIIYLLRHRDKVYDMGKRGVDFVKEEFSYAKVSSLWFQLFSELLWRKIY